MLSKSYKNLLKNPSFRHLFYGFLASLLGDWFTFLATVILLGNHRSSALALAALLILKLLPSSLVSPFGGVFVDKYGPKNCMVIADLIRSIVVLSLLLLEPGESIWVVYFVLVVKSIFSGLFEPGREAILPYITEKKDLVAANTLGGISWSVMIVIGMFFGSLFTEKFGWRSAVFVDSATFLFSAWNINKIQYQFAADKKNISNDQHYNPTFKELVVFLKENPPFIIPILLKAIYQLGGGMYVVILLLGDNYFGRETTWGQSSMYIARGIGAFIGPIAGNIFLNSKPDKLYSNAILGFYLVVFSYSIIVFCNNLYITLFLITAAHAGGAIFWLYSTSLLQTMAPKHLLGRLMGTQYGIAQFVNSISMLLTGVLIDNFKLSVQEALGILVILWLVSLPLLYKGKGFYLLFSNLEDGKKV